MPIDAHPLCKVAFAEARRLRRTYHDLEFASSVQTGTMKKWRHGVQPRQFSIESVLGALGWEIVALPDASEILPALRDDLERLLPLARELLPALAYLPNVAAGDTGLSQRA